MRKKLSLLVALAISLSVCTTSLAAEADSNAASNIITTTSVNASTMTPRPSF